MPFWVGHACFERLQLLDEGLGPIARKNGGEELSHSRAFFKERRISCLVLLYRFKMVDRPHFATCFHRFQRAFLA